MSKSNIIIGALLVVVLVLTIVLIIRKPEPQVDLFDPQPLRDSIALEKENVEFWHDQALRYEAERDGLAVQKQKVKKIYVPQYIYITDDADVSQLDSIIRTNW